MKNIAVISTVRNDAFFTPRWLDYYGRAFGSESLYLILDGRDQSLPEHPNGAHILTMPHVPSDIITGEKRRAKRTSDLASALFHSYDIVIAVDIDEFIAVDPALNLTLAQYLTELEFPGSISALGLDVIQNTALEEKIDHSRPLLAQRRYAQISDRYTKPAIINQPLRWGSGQHRIKGQNFRVDPHLFLFHFGNVDRSEAEARMNDLDRVAAGWTEHQERRNALFDKVATTTPIDGDARFTTARQELASNRRWYALNKPGRLRANDIVTLPKRFRDIV